ncbi:TetR/AcrR family transcriptional regulator [Halalkalibacter urbisdiaboli]|uniref:TetR/AcrR family transcriptional regulator n=1 Tax=Halalkalibacter urbisdiaboli TaxID=1960589 RepID=UPI000B4445CD|nr:TetR/AcrR family transcriptional regulator [Halalkalibacter urbisdiaboli]
MNDKQKQIIKVAMTLFAKNGFHFTSMQEIASEVGMSKGAVYLQFKSKEELLLSIIRRYQEEMFEQLTFIAQDTKHTQEENLAKQIFIQLTLFKENGDFIKILLNEQLHQKSITIKKFLSQTRSTIKHYQKQMLLQAYGDKIEPYLWDLVSLFHGIMKEYQHQLVFEKKPIDIKSASTFIVGRLDALVKDCLTNKPTPVITARMNEDKENKGKELFHSQEEKIAFEINKLEKKINASTFETGHKEDLILTLDHLHKEWKKDVPRRFIVQSFLSFLASAPELEDDVLHLQRLVTLKTEVT